MAPEIYTRTQEEEAELGPVHTEGGRDASWRIDASSFILCSGTLGGRAVQCRAQQSGAGLRSGIARVRESERAEENVCSGTGSVSFLFLFACSLSLPTCLSSPWLTGGGVRRGEVR